MMALVGELFQEADEIKEAKNGVRLVLRTTARHFSHYPPISGRRKAEIRLKFLTLRSPDGEDCRSPSSNSTAITLPILLVLNFTKTWRVGS
jgi:hypothetical protein